MPRKTWYVDDGEARHAAAPDTFEIPTEAERKSCKPGQHVKLIFCPLNRRPDQPSGERMWVLISEVKKNGTYVGTLANQPAFLNGLRHGDRIRFEPKHIITV